MLAVASNMLTRCLLILFSLGVLTASGQKKEQPFQRARLEVSAAGVTVVTQGRVLLDSTLILSAGFSKMSRVPVITEGFDSALCTRYAGWMDTGNADSMAAAVQNLDKDVRTPVRILLGAWYAFQPGAVHYHKAIEQLNMARVEAEKMGKMEWQAQAGCLLMKAYYMLEDTVTGNYWYYFFIRNPAFANLTALRAKTQNYAGIFCPFRPETTGFRLQCLSAALLNYQFLKDTGNQINTLMDLAYLRFANGDPQGAEKAAEQSLQLQEAWHFPYKQYCYDLLAFLKVFAGRYSDALKLAVASLNATEATNDRIYISHVYLRMADVLQQLNDLTAAGNWYKRAMQAAVETRRDEDLYQVLENIGAKNIHLDMSLSAVNTVELLLAKYPPRSANESQLALEALGSAFESAHDNQRAKIYYVRAWQLEKEASKARGGMTNAYLVRKLGRINLLLGDLKASRKFLMMVLSPSPAQKVPQEDLASAYYGMYRVDSASGDFKAAAHWLAQYSELIDKSNFEVQTRQLIDINIKYETLQREKRLQELRAENQLEIQRAANARRLYIAGFILLGCIMLMGYIRFQHNRRTNAQLRAQKEEIDRRNIELNGLNQRQTLLLEEKEWLLREIHHRVKNNLQIITSLLISQSEFLKDETAVKVMLESQHRVEAMSMIHQKLYNSQNLSSIDMQDYIGELVDYLKHSFDATGKVRFELEIEGIRLDVSKAVPVGLILNEAITNAFKYAFPNGGGNVVIRLVSEGTLITLQVADNGNGLPEGFEARSADSFGLILMRGMAEDLEGTIDFDGSHGTVIRVSFNNSLTHPA